QSRSGVIDVKCLFSFYIEKTLSRLAQYLQQFEPGAEESSCIAINSLKCKPISLLLKEHENSLVHEGQASFYHGDFHTDNVIYHKGEYRLIDWRPSFGFSKQLGDCYYDLAKFLHTLHLNVDTMKRGDYLITKYESGIVLEHTAPFGSIEALEAFYDFVRQESYNVTRIRLINALIFINMAPLYEKKLAQYLYLLGRYLLQQITDIEEGS
ncbi:MAG: phosphotransferase, partial [Bdellovibrionales bacterium]|nr:phosphotransferase [Bdellovibrionales bacterium]